MLIYSYAVLLLFLIIIDMGLNSCSFISAAHGAGTATFDGQGTLPQFPEIYRI